MSFLNFITTLIFSPHKMMKVLFTLNLPKSLKIKVLKKNYKTKVHQLEIQEKESEKKMLLIIKKHVISSVELME